MIEKIPVSAYVLTFNNRRTIEACLKSLDWAEELIVVDSFSTDGTYEVCQRYTQKAYQRKWPGHRDQYQYAADLTTKEWIMFVDADEEIPRELVEEIREELERGAEGVDAFFVYRQDLLSWEMDSLRRMVSRRRDSPLSEGEGEMGGRSPCQNSGRGESETAQEPVSAIIPIRIFPIRFRRSTNIPGLPQRIWLEKGSGSASLNSSFTLLFDSSRSISSNPDFEMACRASSSLFRPCSMSSSSMPNSGS